MRRLISLSLASLFLVVGLPVSPSPSAPGAVTGARGSSAAARDQDVLVSRKVAGLNSNPAVEVSPKGDVLVAWERDVLSDSGSGTEVWVALVKRKTSGKFKKKPKPVKLSTGTAFNFGASVAWIEEIQQFFVVWEQDGGSDDSKTILGRAVNGKTGKPAGRVKTLISNDRGNTSPVITATFADGKQSIALVYVSAPNPFARHAARRDEHTSLRSAKITIFLKARKDVEEMRMEDEAQLVVEDVLDLSTEGQACKLILYTVRTSDSRSSHLKLVANGASDREIGLGQKWSKLRGRPGRTSVIVTREPVSAADEGATAKEVTVNCKATTFTPAVDGLLIAQSLTWWGFFNNPDISRQARPEQGGYMTLAQPDGRVYRQVFDAGLNLLGAQELLFDHGSTLTSMIGGNITPESSNRLARRRKKPNRVLVWTKSVGDDFDEEIRARFFYLEPIG